MKLDTFIERLRQLFRRNPSGEYAGPFDESSEETFEEDVYTDVAENDNSSASEDKLPGVRKLRLIIYCFLIVLFLVSAGATFGWVMVNAETTIANRKNIK